MYTCKYCGYKFSRATDIANHVRGTHCNIHWDKQPCKDCGRLISINPAAQHAHAKGCKAKRVPYTCKGCGKEVVIYYGSGKYCSKECANKREQTQELLLKKKIKAIEYLGISFYRDKLLRCLNAVLKKRIRIQTNEEHTARSIQNKAKWYVCAGCGVQVSTSKAICKKCRDLKLYTDFKYGSVTISHVVAKRLLEKYEGHKCSICGISQWNNKYIPMVLDHIDGHAHNNTYSNLRLVCSNCDSQLPTYKRKNRKSDRKKRFYYE